VKRFYPKHGRSYEVLIESQREVIIYYLAYLANTSNAPIFSIDLETAVKAELSFCWHGEAVSTAISRANDVGEENLI
jgi:hypothetical protein